MLKAEDNAGPTPHDELHRILAGLSSSPHGSPDVPHRIEAYRRALELLPHKQDPRLWAELQVGLATSLVQDPLGERAENLEEALRGLRRAMKVIAQDKVPAEWAQAMMTIGSIYRNRMYGERKRNIERAIYHYKQALKVTMREAMPAAWATTMMNLGNAYRSRIRGERAGNIEQAIHYYEQALEVITRDKMLVEWATTMMNLGTAYHSRIREDRADNLEAAIFCYRSTLEVMTRDKVPFGWATTTMNLGSAYHNRIEGGRAENLEEAIHCYQAALEVMTRDKMPEGWAQVMMNLGNSYLDRIKGDRTENLEEAIRCHQRALEVATREVMPVEWAQAMMNIGAAYHNRIRGERGENIEQAIHYYRQAFEVMTREAMPIEWAQTITNLGNAYYSRIRGERVENIEQAIHHYQQGLKVMTRKTMPVDWAQVLMNLGIAYSDRIQGEHLQNLEESIRCYRQALEVRTREAMPVEWATTMMNLGAAYRNREQGEPTENLEESIQCYQQALQVRTYNEMPVEWATTMMNLGNAFFSRVRGERGDNIEQAIHHYQQALRVMTREALPMAWATVMVNLGTVYSDRTQGTRVENIEQAVHYYQQALQVMASDTMPSDHRHVQRNRGDLYFGERRWLEALEAYQAAMAAGDNLLTAAYSEAGRRAEVGETAQLYARAAYCLLQSGQQAKALLMHERGKTRLLSEALALGEADLSILREEQKVRIRDARNAVHMLEFEMRLPADTPSRRDDRVLADLLRQARINLTNMIEVIRKDHPDFMVQGLDLLEILSLIPQGGALVAPLVTSQGTAVFVVQHGVSEVKEKHIVWLDDFRDDDLFILLQGSSSDGAWKGWMGTYLEFRRGGRLSQWQSAIEHYTGELWEKLLAPVYERLQELGIHSHAQVILMPAGGLQLLPLHIAWWMDNESPHYFIDDYEVVYTPSGYTLKISGRRAAERDSTSALVVGINHYADPDISPLFNAVPEAEMVSRLLGNTPLLDIAATKMAVMAHTAGRGFLHFSCHGGYAWGNDPLDSGLVMHDTVGAESNTWLTLRAIIGELDLSAARLVTLSACETGVTDIRQSPDEYVGLPAGFLQKGAPAVICSLWTVDDRSMALLMEHFYRSLLEKGMDFAAALREAQLWLRNATREEIGDYYKSYLRLTIDDAEERFIEIAMGGEPDEKPYAHPFYWASLTFNGA